MQIVYIIETLAIVGGLEKIVTEKANYLADKFGYDVTIITCTQRKDQNNAFHLSPNVKQIHLAIPYYKQYYYKYPIRLWIKFQIRELLKRELTNTINSMNPDFIIGTLKFEADLICQLECKTKKIIECHEVRYFSLLDLEKKRNFLSRIYLNYYKRENYFKVIENKADILVTLTQDDKALWNNARRVEVIPNFSTMPLSIHTCSEKRVIAVGRLSAEKGYDRLITIWEQVSRKHPDWQLDIFGDGNQHTHLLNIIKYNNSHITIHHSTTNISQEYAKSSIYVMTSLYEGFSLSLLEAMRNGLPCIAFDCPFGPRTMITNNKNGYLIENGNIQLFVDKLNYLIDHPETRSRFAQSANKYSETFNIEKVMELWQDVFSSLKV